MRAPSAWFVRRSQACVLAAAALVAGLAVSPSALALELWELGSGDARFVTPASDPVETEDDTVYYRDSTGAEYEVRALGGLSVSCRPTPADPWRSITQSINLSLAEVPAVAGIVGDHLIAWLGRQNAPNWEAYVWDVRCADWYAGAPAVRAAFVALPAFEAPAAWGTAASTRPLRLRLTKGIFEFGGRACAGEQVALWCLDLAAPEDGFQILLEASDLPAQIDDGPQEQDYLLDLWHGQFADEWTPTVSWEFRGYRALPGGGAAIGAKVRLDNTTQGVPSIGPFEITWVLRLSPDGSITTRFEGAPRLTKGLAFSDSILQLPGIIGDAAEIHYDPTWDALWVGPVFGAQPSGLWYESEYEQGYFGFGYRILPLSEPGSGYLDLTDAWGRLDRCYQPFPTAPCGVNVMTGALTEFGDELRFRIPDPDGGNFGTYEFALELDRDAVDLDGDGLSRAEEAALGLSDYDADVDDDLVDDRLEMVTGTDPKVADNPVSLPAFPVSFIASPVLSYRLGVGEDFGTTEGVLWQGFGRFSSLLRSDGPLCRFDDGTSGCQTCRDASGEAEVQLCSDFRGEVTISHDGLWLVYTNKQSVERVDRATGAESTWITWDRVYPFYADILRGDTTQQLHFYPVDADNLWITNTWDGNDDRPDAVRVVHVDGAGTPRVNFDIPVEACAGGAYAAGAPCTEVPAFDVQPYRINGFSRWPINNEVQAFVGYHEQSGRMLLALGGKPESFLVGLDPTEPPIVFQRARELKHLVRDSYARALDADWGTLFPAFLHRLADGFYFTEVGLVGPRFERVPTNPWAPRVYPDSDLRFDGFWNDTILDQRGVEWVRYERRVSPGDTLLLQEGRNPNTGGDHGYMLYAIGPRGGANPLWEHARTDIEGPTGMHLAADGRLCVADRVGQRLIELAPEDASKVPTKVVRTTEGIDVIDCTYAGGTLQALLGGPPSVVPIEAGGNAGPPEPVSGTGEPAGFIDEPDGSYEIFWLDAASPVRGVFYDADGTRQTLNDGSANDPLHPEQKLSLNEGSVWRAALRPDGRLITLFATIRVHAFAPDEQLLALQPTYRDLDGTGLPVVFLDPSSAHHALAQVPGGSSLDPWTGLAPEGPPPPGPDGATAETDRDAGSADSDPSDADVSNGPDGADTASSPASSSSGCAGAQGGQGDSSALLLLTIALALALGRRINRAEP
ncbi:MAG: hypothetical protein H6744_17885 [Deltaproteobacteria bacterium]|nr:hypothetical protein [Deltaproteobacteria bacterium]